MTTDTATASASPSPMPRHTGRRIFKWIVILVLLVLIVGGVVLYMNLNHIVKVTVEKQSASSLNVPTSLGGANVSLFGGSVNLNDFTVSSPAPFNAQMMALGGIDVQTKFNELRADPVRISSININSPKLVIEMHGTDFNIKKFIDSLPAGEDKPTPEGEKPLKLVIGKLNLTGAQVIFRPDLQALAAIPGVGQNLGGLKNEYT